MNRICAIIPARYQSSRLPGKPLLKINNKTIIQRTYEQTIKSKYINDVYVATDDDRIINHVNNFGKTIKITTDCLNGTERICHAIKQLNNQYDIIVNIQGDEPFVNPKHIDLVIKKYLENKNDKSLVCTTLHYKIPKKDIKNPTIGKMVMDKNNNVMYCSRNYIPCMKNGEPKDDYPYMGHIGVFVFRESFLSLFLNHHNTTNQLVEDIEWLKIIEMGYKIKSYEVNEAEIGVNTKNDYDYLVNKYG